MAYVYVYAPVSGWNWGQDTYCSGGQHTVVSALGGCCPIDIGGASAETPLYFYGSSLIKSIRTRRVSGVCVSDPAPWTYGVVVDFFGQLNAQCPIGTVGYGHVKSRIADGVYNTNSIEIGRLPPNCGCSCSTAIHVHIQRTGGSSQSFSCYQYLYAGSTWIYRWYWNPAWC